MYKQGERVVYGLHGVCEILNIEVKRNNNQNAEYYVLRPTKNPSDRFYVPMHNPAALAKLRPLLSKAELDALLISPEIGYDSWIEDENRRKQRYRELITSGDRAALISMIKALHIHKSAQLSQGRKFHLCDENFLRDAENLLSNEFSVVLDIPQESVGQYIINRITG